ncbi:hypothetical protein B0H13DRAFT_1951626, partial [Mycena leptocephala]
LIAGRRVIVNKPNSTYATHYAHYNTHVWCTKGTGNSTIPADIRVYITSSTPPLADGMVVFVVCSAQLIAVPPATNSLPTNTLDAMTFFVLPGSPDSDTYNASVVL